MMISLRHFNEIKKINIKESYIDFSIFSYTIQSTLRTVLTLLLLCAFYAYIMVTRKMCFIYNISFTKTTLNEHTEFDGFIFDIFF